MFLAVDKPARITSFDIIRIIRKHIPHKKIGHGGTLDPMATGLMILALDDDTKKLTEIIGKDKSYIATIDFSKLTDTRDLEYWEIIINYEFQNGKLKIENGKLVDAPSLENIKQTLELLIPEYKLPIPAFSAKKRSGKRSYHDARAGKIREEKKVMKVQKFEILNYEFPILQLKIDVSSGTYIRSIAYRLGKKLGLGGTLIQLRRTSIGNIDIDQLQNWKKLHNMYKGKEEILRYCVL